MVAVFMGNEYGVYLVGRQAGLTHSCFHGPDTQTAIDQQTGTGGAAAGLHHRGVARAAACQAPKAQHLENYFKSSAITLTMRCALGEASGAPASFKTATVVVSPWLCTEIRYFNA